MRQSPSPARPTEVDRALLSRRSQARDARPVPSDTGDVCLRRSAPRRSGLVETAVAAVSRSVSLRGPSRSLPRPAAPAAPAPVPAAPPAPAVLAAPVVMPRQMARDDGVIAWADLFHEHRRLFTIYLVVILVGLGHFAWGYFSLSAVPVPAPMSGSTGSLDALIASAQDYGASLVWRPDDAATGKALGGSNGTVRAGHWARRGPTDPDAPDVHARVNAADACRSVVVLGAWRAPTDELSAAFRRRVEAALAAAHYLRAREVVFTGGHGDSALARQYFQTLAAAPVPWVRTSAGLRTLSLLLEDNSTSTATNLVQAGRIVARSWPDTESRAQCVAVVSSAYHLRRAQMLFWSGFGPHGPSLPETFARAEDQAFPRGGRRCTLSWHRVSLLLVGSTASELELRVPPLFTAVAAPPPKPGAPSLRRLFPQLVLDAAHSLVATRTVWAAHVQPAVLGVWWVSAGREFAAAVFNVLQGTLLAHAREPSPTRRMPVVQCDGQSEPSP